MKQSDYEVRDRFAVGEAGGQIEEGHDVTDVVAASIAMLAETAVLAWALGLTGDEEVLCDE